MQAYEIAIFILYDSSSVKEEKDALTKYKDNRAEAFSGYAPVQSAMIENGSVVTHGNYAALLVCEDPKNAEAVFMACFSSNPPQIGNVNLLPPQDSTESPNTDAGTAEPDHTAPDKPVTDAPSPGAPATDVPATGAPATDAPSTDAPATDAPATDVPTTDVPATDAPVTDSPTGAPETDAPITNKPTDAPTDIPATAPSEPPATTEQDDKYDPASIIKAWHSGNATHLTEKNRKILDACIEVIGALIDEGMSDYEKELAIHDWIIDWADYDEESLSNSPNAKPDPDNDNPYGTIYGKKAICAGFTTTFQLFMDMLGVECISVKGYYNRNGEDHAWNMVRIDGEWYCVDVTWDDPIGGNWSAAMKHRFFNETSQFFKDTGHVWDESTTPVADSGKLYSSGAAAGPGSFHP
jgi:hypothetical protein